MLFLLFDTYIGWCMLQYFWAVWRCHDRNHELMPWPYQVKHRCLLRSMVLATCFLVDLTFKSKSHKSIFHNLLIFMQNMSAYLLRRSWSSLSMVSKQKFLSIFCSSKLFWILFCFIPFDATVSLHWILCRFRAGYCFVGK